MTIIEQLEARTGTMTLMDLATLLGVSYKTVYKWARMDGLPATKIGGTYWIDPQLAARWWSSHSTTAGKPPMMQSTDKAAHRVA